MEIEIGWKVKVVEVSVPKQKNSYDCGVHVIRNIETIVTRPECVTEDREVKFDIADIEMLRKKLLMDAAEIV